MLRTTGWSAAIAALGLWSGVASEAAVSVCPTVPAQTVNLDNDPFFDVTFLADLGTEHVVGWALDFSTDESLAFLLNYEVDTQYWLAGGPQPDEPGVVDVGALAPFTSPGYVTGNGIGLVTLHFVAVGLGDLTVVGDHHPAQLEGFALDPSGFVEVINYSPALVTIMPEPATALLLAALAGVCRRR